LWLLWRVRPAPRDLAIVLPPFVLGSLPWWLYNARHHWASRTETAGTQGSVVSHLHDLVSATLPTALGLRLPFTLGWLLPVAVAATIYVVALVALAAAF